MDAKLNKTYVAKRYWTDKSLGGGPLTDPLIFTGTVNEQEYDEHEISTPLVKLIQETETYGYYHIRGIDAGTKSGVDSSLVGNNEKLYIDIELFNTENDADTVERLEFLSYDDSRQTSYTKI